MKLVKGTDFTVAQFEDAVFVGGWDFAVMELILHGGLSRSEMKELILLLQQEINRK